MTAPAFRTDEAFARSLDEADPLRRFRDEFLVPGSDAGNPVHYFAGNSLGLEPRRVREVVLQELEEWGTRAVDGHLEAATPWYTYHESVRGPLARLVGAREPEVVAMNGLTVNLHLLMVSFYRPTRERYRIVIEDPVFPSDLYAVKTQIRHHGLDPEDALVQVGPRPGEHLVREEDLEAALAREGGTVALLWIGGVNFLTGQRFDLARLSRAAHEVGALAGFDLAHAVGNVPLRLHDEDVDFAVWCSYKYLNAGPGATAGAYVHERHAGNTALPRFGGWWGNDPATRFRMQLEPEFVPVPSADAWQLSNPPVLALAPLRASLQIFEEAGMDALRAKSERLTGYLEFLLATEGKEKVRIGTPSQPPRRGCQLSLEIDGDARGVQRELAARGIVCDFREPNVVRAAPVPLYNTFHDVWTLARVLNRKG
jgi:kynureninase